MHRYVHLRVYSTLAYTVISAKMCRETLMSSCTLAQRHCVRYQVQVFYFNNSPPAFMVIRFVSKQPLNLKMLSKSTKKTLWSNLAAWETDCVCVSTSAYSQLNIMWKKKNIFNLFNDSAWECCETMLSLYALAGDFLERYWMSSPPVGLKCNCLFQL